VTRDVILEGVSRLHSLALCLLVLFLLLGCNFIESICLGERCIQVRIDRSVLVPRIDL
jgi:hypothetical protein